MWRLANNETSFLGHALTAAIDCHKIVVATTFNVKGNLRRIIDDDRTDVQTVRSHRRQTKAATLRNDDRSTIGEIVSRGTRRRSHDKTIRLVSNEKLAIHLSTDGNHRGIVTFQHGDVVEGERIAGKDASLCLHLDHGMVFYHAVTSIETIQCWLYLARQHIGEKAQSSHVHTDDRRFLGTHPARRLEESAVATHRDDIIHIKVIVLEHARRIDMEMLVAGQELIISILEINLSPLLVEVIKDFFDASRLLGLVFIAKYCEFKMLQCHLL